MNATKRIPVTEQRWAELSDMKKAGQTYDELLEELIQERRRQELAHRVREVRETDAEELTTLDEISSASQ